MKFVYFLVIFLSLHFAVTGQKPRPKPKTLPPTETQTKLSTPKPAGFTRETIFYAPEFVEDNSIVVAGNPALTQKMIDNNRYFYELYFDIDFTSEEKQIFKDLLIKNWKNNSTKQQKIVEISNTFECWYAVGFIKAGSKISSLRQNEIYAAFMPVNSIGGNLEKEAKSGDLLAAFLVGVIEEYAEPLFHAPKITIDNMMETLNQRSGIPTFNKIQIDRFTKLIVFQATAVAGRRISDVTNEMRRQMRDYWVNLSKQNP